MSLPLSADIITLLRLSGCQSAVLDVIIRPPEDDGVSSTTPLVIRLERIRRRFVRLVGMNLGMPFADVLVDDIMRQFWSLFSKLMWVVTQLTYSFFSILSTKLLSVLFCCLRSNFFTVLPDQQSFLSTCSSTLRTSWILGPLQDFIAFETLFVLKLFFNVCLLSKI